MPLTLLQKFSLLKTKYRLENEKKEKKKKMIWRDSDQPQFITPSTRISDSSIEVKINWNIYFHTSLWCLKRFYEGLKGFHKSFRGTLKKSDLKSLC